MRRIFIGPTVGQKCGTARTTTNSRPRFYRNGILHLSLFIVHRGEWRKESLTRGRFAANFQMPKGRA
jgi:hypothetical protein